MGKITYRPVFYRKKRLNEQGKALLQVEAYLSGKRAYFSTHIYLTPRQWNGKKCRIVHHPEAKSLNYLLREFIMQLECKELELWRKGVDVTLEVLKRELKPESSSSFLEFVGQELEVICMKESTRKNQMTTWKLLFDFRPKLKFEGLTLHFVQEFERFMERRGLGINTIAKHLKHLRTFVNWAIAKGCMKEEDYPFRRFRIKMEQGKHAYLTLEEMERLEELVLPEEHRLLQHALDGFLFCCYTGLRYSDFVRLRKENIVRQGDDVWMVFHSLKTGVEVRLPLLLLFKGKAWKILNRYRDGWDRFFCLKSNACVNHDLKTIGTLAGIEKHFTFHSARHTNATLLIYEGVNITTVQKLLGHRNIATTQIYSEVMEQTIVKDLTKERG